jgi:hypothetical protein
MIRTLLVEFFLVISYSHHFFGNLIIIFQMQNFDVPPKQHELMKNVTKMLVWFSI